MISEVGQYEPYALMDTQYDIDSRRNRRRNRKRMMSKGWLPARHKTPKGQILPNLIQNKLINTPAQQAAAERGIDKKLDQQIVANQVNVRENLVEQIANGQGPLAQMALIEMINPQNNGIVPEGYKVDNNKPGIGIKDAQLSEEQQALLNSMKERPDTKFFNFTTKSVGQNNAIIEKSHKLPISKEDYGQFIKESANAPLANPYVNTFCDGIDKTQWSANNPFFRNWYHKKLDAIGKVPKILEKPKDWIITDATAYLSKHSRKYRELNWDEFCTFDMGLSNDLKDSFMKCLIRYCQDEIMSACNTEGGNWKGAWDGIKPIDLFINTRNGQAYWKFAHGIPNRFFFAVNIKKIATYGGIPLSWKSIVTKRFKQACYSYISRARTSDQTFATMATKTANSILKSKAYQRELANDPAKNGATQSIINNREVTRRQIKNLARKMFDARVGRYEVDANYDPDRLWIYTTNALKTQLVPGSHGNAFNSEIQKVVEKPEIVTLRNLRRMQASINNAGQNIQSQLTEIRAQAARKYVREFAP